MNKNCKYKIGKVELERLYLQELMSTGMVEFREVVAKQDELYKLFAILKGDK